MSQADDAPWWTEGARGRFKTDGKFRTRRPKWWREERARVRKGCGDGYADLGLRTGVLLWTNLLAHPADADFRRPLLIAAQAGLDGPVLDLLFSRFRWMKKDVRSRNRKAFKAALIPAMLASAPPQASNTMPYMGLGAVGVKTPRE